MTNTPKLTIRALYFFIFCFFLCSGSIAQNYTRDVGLIVGKGVFISYRNFINEEKAFETMAGFSKKGFKIIGLREFFNPMLMERTKNLNLIYGFGMHIGINYTNHYKVLYRTYYHNWMWTPQLGVDGLIGTEYAIIGLPLLVSAKMQPYFEFSTKNFFDIQATNFMVSINYRF